MHHEVYCISWSSLWSFFCNPCIPFLIYEIFSFTCFHIRTYLVFRANGMGPIYPSLTCHGQINLLNIGKNLWFWLVRTNYCDMTRRSSARIPNTSYSTSEWMQAKACRWWVWYTFLTHSYSLVAKTRMLLLLQ